MIITPCRCMPLPTIFQHTFANHNQQERHTTHLPRLVRSLVEGSIRFCNIPDAFQPYNWEKPQKPDSRRVVMLLECKKCQATVDAEPIIEYAYSFSPPEAGTRDIDGVYQLLKCP